MVEIGILRMTGVAGVVHADKKDQSDEHEEVFEAAIGRHDDSLEDVCAGREACEDFVMFSDGFRRIARYV